MTFDRRVEGATEDLPDQIDAVQARMQALWPQIASDLGIATQKTRFRRLQVNRRKENHRGVMLVTVPDGSCPTGTQYVLRADFDRARSDRFSRILERHRAAAAALRSVPGVAVPDILWQDPQAPIFLMEHAEGDTAYRTLAATEYGIGDRDDVLRRIGAAVASLHQVSRIKNDRLFWPKPHLQRISDCAQAVRAGQIQLPRPKKFLGLCALLHRAARLARQAPYSVVVEHGDLHFRNILVSDKCVSFIDFSNHRGTYAHRDLATLWLANCPDHLAQDGGEPGFGLVARQDWAAFQDGYGADLVNDPVFRFFFAQRLFNSWLQLADAVRPHRAQATRAIEAHVQVFEALLADETRRGQG